MILGDTCTRACAFCNVKTGLPGPLDPYEPGRVAEATAKLGLAHIVVTSVDRDDLERWRRGPFRAHHPRHLARVPGHHDRVLTPDFLRKDGAVEQVVAARPDVFNHNLETVPSRYLTVRRGARYFASLRLLQRVKEINPTLFTKSGIMVGLGEETERGAAGDGRLALGRRRFPDHRPVSATDPQASSGDPVRAPEEFKSLKTMPSRRAS